MDKYKCNPSNANKQKSIKSFKNFLQSLNEVGAELISDYTSSDDPVDIFCHGIILKSRPIDFQRKTGKNIKKFLNICLDEGYVFLRFVTKVNTYIIAEVQSPNGEIFKIAIGSFEKFLKTNNELRKDCEELGILLLSDYIGIDNNITYNIYGIVVTSRARDLKSSIIRTIKK